MRLFSRMPVFHRILASYILVALLVILLLLPVYATVYDQAVISETSEIRQNLSKGGSNISSAINDLLSTRSTLENNLSYSIMSMRTDISDLPLIYKISEIGTSLRQLVALSSDISELYIIFPKSNLVVTKNGGVVDTDRWISLYLRYENQSVPQLLQTIRESRESTFFFPAQSVSLDQRRWIDGVTYVNRGANDTPVICGIIDTNRILTMFNVPSMHPETFFYLCDNNGTILASQQYDSDTPLELAEDISQADGYTIVRHKLMMLGGEAVVGVPRSVFYEKTSAIRNTILVYIFLALSGGILLAAGFSFAHYMPLLRLIKSAANGGYDRKTHKANEYDYIRQTIEAAFANNKLLTDELAGMEVNLRSSLFLRALYDSPRLQGDEQSLLSLLPALGGDYRVAAVTFANTDGEELGEYPLISSALSHLRLALSVTGADMNLHIDRLSTRQFVLLLPGREVDALDALMTALDSIDEYHPYGKAFHLGCSDVHANPEELQNAFYEANFCVSYARHSQTRRLLHEQLQSNASDTPDLRLEVSRKLYHLFSSYTGERERAELDGIIAALQDDATVSTNQDGVMIALRNLLENFMVTQGFPLSEYPLPLLRGDTERDNILIEFNQVVNVLLMQIESHLGRSRQSLVQAVLSCIQDNFTDPNFSASALCGKFDIGERSLARILQENTGMSFHKHVEMLRMRTAGHLVQAGDIPVAQIAESSGFYSTKTFYRVFKKYYGMSPSAYRDDHRHEDLF